MGGWQVISVVPCCVDYDFKKHQNAFLEQLHNAIVFTFNSTSTIFELPPSLILETTTS